MSPPGSGPTMTVGSKPARAKYREEVRAPTPPPKTIIFETTSGLVSGFMVDSFENPLPDNRFDKSANKQINLCIKPQNSHDNNHCTSKMINARSKKTRSKKHHDQDSRKRVVEKILLCYIIDPVKQI
jgi:hypothetical protein